MIIFQVTELHRLRGQELQNELRHYGITSETGYSRYNFDPPTLLECSAGLEDSLREEAVVAGDWPLLGGLSDLGRYSGLTKIRTRRRAADSTDSTARRDNAVLVFVNSP